VAGLLTFQFSFLIIFLVISFEFFFLFVIGDAFALPPRRGPGSEPLKRDRSALARRPGHPVPVVRGNVV